MDRVEMRRRTRRAGEQPPVESWAFIVSGVAAVAPLGR